MVEISVDPEVVKEAAIKAKEMGVLNNSITKGRSNIYGLIGEIIVSNYLKVKLRNTFDYDLIKKKKKIDVKTKSCSSSPKPEYQCSITAIGSKQKCDSYIFVRVHNDMSRAWILGSISKRTFFKNAKFGKKGEIDPTSNSGWCFKADCYNLPIKNLTKIEDFLKKL